MADQAHDWTDEQIEALERKFNSTYSQAEKEMRAKLDEYLKDFDEKNKVWQAEVRAGKATHEQYQGWLKSQSLRREYLSDMCDTLAADASRTNQLAFDMINDELPRIYAENANYAAYSIESQLHSNTHAFDLVDQSTVRRLIGLDDEGQVIKEVVISEEEVSPPLRTLRKVNIKKAKDVRWNRQKFNAALTQSILQGESIPSTAKRMARVLNMDRSMAVRAARTAMTSAENAGRVDSYHRANGIGIDLEQEWLATLDERTRNSHRELDGQHVPVGEKFKIPSSGNELEFPADPTAEPSEVWNCRCTLVAWFPEDGIESAANRFSRLPDGITYEQWKDLKRAEIASHEELANSASDIDELQKIVSQRQSEIDKILSMKTAEDSHLASYFKDAIEETEAKLKELEWTRSADRSALESEAKAVENKIYEINERLFNSGLSTRTKEWDDLMNECNRLMDISDELYDKLSAFDDYDRLARRLAEYREKYNDAIKGTVSMEEYKEARKRIPELVRSRNDAIKALSDAQPFAPDVRDKLGNEYADAMDSLISAASERHPEIASAYRMFSSQLKIDDYQLSSGAYYSRGTKGIFFNAANVASGNSYERPYQTAFHEFGHLIDNVSQYDGIYLGESNGLAEVIRSDWVRFRNEMGRRHGVSRDKNGFTIGVLKDEMRADPEGRYNYSNISDIIEGCTRTSYPLGFGHGASYHRGMLNNNGPTAHEFVAELYDAAMTSEGSYEQMKRVFPNAVELVESITRELVS